MNNCKIDLNKLQGSLIKLKRDVFKRLSLIRKNLTPEEAKFEILKMANLLGESYKINPETVDVSLEAFNTQALTKFGEAIPSKEELKNALLAWQKPVIDNFDHPSTDSMDNKEKNQQDRIIDDPLGFAYGRALKAKMRATQHTNTVGVHSILYNEDGIINTIEDLNSAIVSQQELLLQNVINYLNSKGINISGTLYKNGEYTGIIDDIKSRYEINFKFDFNELNDLYNRNDFTTLDAYSSWIILNNFDTLLKKTFGKAINIDPDKSKFSINKYSVAGGSNVYTTWRINEEIDLSKEINNISQAIITSLPYYLADSTSPSEERNLKFNEFVYLITKLKDIPLNLTENYIIRPSYLQQLNPETAKFLDGKSIAEVINTLRDNPQKVLGYLMEAFNNKNIFEQLQAVLPKDYFSSIDREIINTIYLGIFNQNNSSSLLAIQNKSGFKDNNYYAFITLTIDSIYKSNFLQYFRNPEGEIYVRPMYDLSLYVIELNLKTNINQSNMDLDISEFNTVDDTKDDFYDSVPNGPKYYTINGIKYVVEVFRQDDNIYFRYLEQNTNKVVTDENVKNQLDELIKKQFAKPSVITYTYDNYHAGPLKVQINLNDGSIQYSVNGTSFKEFLMKKDYDSLLPLIEKVLKLNFNIDINYLNAFANRVVELQGVSKYGNVATDLMNMVSRIIANKYIQDNYIIGTDFSSIKSRLNDIFGKDKVSYKPTYNSKIHHLNLLTDAEVTTLNNLAQAKALVTGRLTSSQIINGEGNALASSALSRLVNSLLYQVDTLIKKIENSAAKGFSLWNPGVYKGVFQLAEMKDNYKSTSKNHTLFSNKEMENALVFVDFLLGLTTKNSTRSPYTDGIVGFYPSENSDKTYVGRILIDLKNLKVGDTNVYELIRNNPAKIVQFYPTIRLELFNFYKLALDNINSEWSRVGELLGVNIGYDNWSELERLANENGMTTIDYLNSVVTNYNFNHPFTPITLTENVHYVNLNGKLIPNSSLVGNLIRLETDAKFNSFIKEREVDILKSLLKDGVEIEATPEIRELLKDPNTKLEKWIDPYTNKVILAWQGNRYIKRNRDFDPSDTEGIELNPLISAYNSLNYFVTQEYMNSSVGAYYAHPNKKSENILELVDTGQITEKLAFQKILNDEKVRKLAQDKRNVSFTAAMHAMQKNLIQGIPGVINIAVMPDVRDSFVTISGDAYLNDIEPYDGATFTNPFYQVLLNYSLGGAKVGLIKKTFTHYYDEKTGTGGIIKTAEFPLNNEYIRRSKFYGVMMKNMTDRIWRNKNGEPCNVDITTDYTGQPIIFSNPESDEGYMYFQDKNTGEYYMFNIVKGDSPNTYIRTKLKVDLDGLPTEDEPVSEVFVVNTNYQLWNMFGGEYSMSFNKGKFHPSEHSINLVVTIMNNTTIEGEQVPNARTQEDVFQPLKHSDIHLMPTVGAVKQGAANVNNIDTYTTADASKINHFRIRMNQVGVQLDKEHQADGEDLSIMTLVLSACAARGYTPEMTLNLYNAMARLAESGIRPYLLSFEEFFRVSRQSELADTKIDSALLETARQRFENTLLNTLIKALATSTNAQATVQIVTQELLEKAKKGEEIDFANVNIPLSDPAIMRKLHSTISVALTKAAIKIKVDGSLNILCPSFGITKIYNGKMRENYLNDKAIDDELEVWDANDKSNLLSRPSEIKIGRTYKVTDRDGYLKLVHINTVEDYWKFRDTLSQYTKVQELFGRFILYAKNTMIKPEDIRALVDGSRTYQDKIKILLDLNVDIDTDFTPRNLEEYVISHIGGLNKKDIKEHTGFSDKDLNKFIGLYSKAEGISVDRLSENIAGELIGTPLETDSDIIRNIILDALQTAQKETDITRFIEINRINNALSSYEEEYTAVEANIELYPEEVFEGGRELASYNVTFSGNIQIDEALGDFATQQITESFNLYDLVSVKNLHDLKASKNYTKILLDLALAEVQEDLNKLHSKSGQVLTHKGLVTINPNSVNIEPYEIIMPKIFATVFGLEPEDDLNTIKNNPQFFTERLIKNLTPTHSDYTICLLRINGNHTYILDRNNAVLNERFRPKEIQTIREDGKLYRYLGNEKLYEIGENDEVWEKIDSSGNATEVIITDNPLSYLDRIDFTTLNINRLNSYEYNADLINKLKESKNKNVQNYLEAFNKMLEREGETFDNALEDIQEINYKTLNDSPVGDWYKKLGNLIYSSFLKSLEVVAARIPAQSMQSFMPMKVAGFERSDRNTAYVATTQFLFLGSDLDIDAVSLASFAFDKSGRYILHSPFANIDTFELLKLSETIPFPTGIELEINDDDLIDYSQLISYIPEKNNFKELEGYKLDLTKPFHLLKGNRVEVNTSTVEAMNALINFINYCNKNGHIPSSNNPYYNAAVLVIAAHINNHNNYINTSKDVAEFSKNYMVNSMFTIGLSPANLIESQQAMDEITGPLKAVASNTLKALNEQANDNPADFTTNVHGFVLNMDGKQGVGICAVGLKGFFAATARYNDVLDNGTPEEVRRLMSDVRIANRNFQLLANVYTTNEVNRAILGGIIELLDLGKDAALILSGLLSLATDNAKELALSKLNASKMLGMYIYGIAIGMDFRDIASIIASKTGQVIDSLIREDVITNSNGMNFENIFDYLEVGPNIIPTEKVPGSIKKIYDTYLSDKILMNLAWGKGYLLDGKLILLKDTSYQTIGEVIQNHPNAITYLNLNTILEKEKKLYSEKNEHYNSAIEFNRNIEKAQLYLAQIRDIITDLVRFNDGRPTLYNNGSYSTVVNNKKVQEDNNNEITFSVGQSRGVYDDFKKLYWGGEEMRTLGLLLHINQGNETSYIDSIKYIDTVESVMSSAKYRLYREWSRLERAKGNGYPKNNSKKYEFNFHKFITIPLYREGCIDLYGGICREDLFMKSPNYREIFLKARTPEGKTLEEQYQNIIKNLQELKVFINILDVLNVPHYDRYLLSADMLHQLMQNSIKYRAIYKLGKVAVQEIGAYSAKDRENIFRRTEQLVDRFLRDRFFISKGINFEIPAGIDTFERDSENNIKLKKGTNSPTFIKLGTREGNASFKKFMEDEVIPNLKRMDRFKNNKFIQSLEFTLFSANPELLVTRCMAPNINMSPRSEVDSALFEEVKHDFNNFRTNTFMYPIGDKNHNLINLFYYYNLIAFGGRVGENTLTNIFQDMLDYESIANYRYYESQLDKYGEFELISKDGGNISLDTLIRETAPRANELSTKLNYFYQENWRTGELSFNERNPTYGRIADDEGHRDMNRYTHNPVAFTKDKDAKNYLVQSSDTDVVQSHFKLSNGQSATILIEKGSVTHIEIDGVPLEIKGSDKIFFRNLKMISKITPEGVLEKYYNKLLIISKIEELIKCN